jgi:AraC-like DNA-binding protein
MQKPTELVISQAPNNIQVHRLPRVPMRKIHRDSGLWIFRWGSNHAFRDANSAYTYNNRYFEFYCISHMFSGNGFYWRPGQDVLPVKAGQCILASPGTEHNYGPAPHSDYQEDTLNFTGPLADMMFKSGVFADGIYDLGPARRLSAIFNSLSDPSDHAQLNAGLALQQFLYDLYNKRFREHGRERYPEIDELLKLLREQPERWWSIDEMAAYCNMSDDQFRRVFRKRVGMLPKLYVDRMKLNHAAAMLTGTRLSIAEIAEKIGYTDQYHFNRRFKEIMGMPPGHYRRDSFRH